MNYKLVAAVMACASLVACGNDLDRKAIGKSSATTAAAAAADESASAPETTTEESPSTTTTAEEPEEKEAALTVESGFTSGVDSIDTRYTTAGALVTNPNKTLAAYDVTAVFNLLDAEGTVLDTDSANIAYIPAGATVPVSPLQIGFDLDEEPADLSVDIAGTFSADEGWDGVDGFMMGDGIDLEVEGPAIAKGDYGSDLGFTVTNPSEVVVEYASWACVFRQGGKVVGGETSSVSDPIVPKGKVKVDSSVSVDGLTADEITCRAFG